MVPITVGTITEPFSRRFHEKNGSMKYLLLCSRGALFRAAGVAYAAPASQRHGLTVLLALWICVLPWVGQAGAALLTAGVLMVVMLGLLLAARQAATAALFSRAEFTRPLLQVDRFSSTRLWGEQTAGPLPQQLPRDSAGAPRLLLTRDRRFTSFPRGPVRAR